MIKAQKHTRVVKKGTAQGRLTAAQVGDINARVLNALHAAQTAADREWPTGADREFVDLYIRAFLNGVGYGMGHVNFEASRESK